MTTGTAAGGVRAYPGTVPDRQMFRVIVIDDEDDMRNLMWTFLTRHLPSSCRVHALGDVGWQEGVPWDQVSVAIVDIMMPVTDGRDILRWVAETYPACYRIAWTGAKEVYEPELMGEGLAHTVIGKPGLDTILEHVMGFAPNG